MAGTVITLYDAARCPYCARVRIVLADKAIPYETVEIDLSDRPSWLYEMNPVGKVPILDEDGWILPESAVIAEFLNERYPEPPLWPDDPGERAAGRLLVFRFDDFSKPYYAFRRGEDGARGRFEEELGFLDGLLGGTPWLSGRAFGLADVAFLPVVAARARPARHPARAVAGARRLGRALVPAPVGRGRAAAGRGAVTVVFLHAFPLDERMWDADAPRLYGLGRTMDDWADAVLESYPGRLILVGASMGGYAAMAAARRAPERLAGLLLVGSRPEADTPERYAKRAETIAIARDRGAEGVWEAMRATLFTDDSDPEVVALARELALDRTEEELVTGLEAIRDRPDSTAAYRALGERALTVVGDRDPFVPVEDARRFEPDAVVLAGCGHLPSLERPAEFHRVLDEEVARWT